MKHEPIRHVTKRYVLAIVLAAMAIASACSTATETVTPAGDPAVDGTGAPEPIATTVPQPTAATQETPTAAAEPTAVRVATASPEPEAVPVDDSSGVCAGPPDELAYRLEVINVEPDDPDGGLVVHNGPGVSAPAIDVLPWDAGNVRYVFKSCDVVDDGGEWWQIEYGDAIGWVNAYYLGDRTVADDAFDVTPCATESDPAPTVDPERSADAETPPPPQMAIADFDLISSPECDRLVVTLAQGWNFNAMTTSIPMFPGWTVQSVALGDQSLELAFSNKVASAFDSVWFREAWRDVATNEQNVALAFDREQRQPSVYVGWGTGTASVRYLDAPARVVIDIVQEATPEGSIAGPVVGSAVLFEPIQTDLNGPGVELPIVLRGFSRGFEATSSFEIAPWGQTPAEHPFEWGGLLFGQTGQPPFDQAIAFGELPSGRTHVQPPFGFTTAGLFAIEITELAPGGYQLAVSPSVGCFASPFTGQQFRVADPAVTADPSVEFPAAATFAQKIEFTNRTNPDVVALSTISVLDEQRTTSISEDPC